MDVSLIFLNSQTPPNGICSCDSVIGYVRCYPYLWESHAGVWRVSATMSTTDFQMVWGEGRERGYDNVTDSGW